MVLSNIEIENNFKVVKFLEDSGLLIKGVIKSIGNEAKEKKSWNSWYVVSHISSKFF